MVRDVRSIASTPGALRLFLVSVVARLPLAMISIGLLVHAEHLTGSFAAAGVVAGALAMSQAIGSPLLGRLVDRRGQTTVLLAGGLVAAAALASVAALPAGTPIGALVALAAVLGLANPPVGACMRALFPAVLSDQHALRAAYAVEAAAVELTWVAGPPFVLVVGALWSTGAALGTAAAVLMIATAVFAAHPASRTWQPAPDAKRPRGGSLRTPAMRTLVLLLVAVGGLFGATEVAIAAAADALDASAATGPLFGLWGVGSLVGGLVAARAGGGARTGAGLALLLAGLAAGHLALAPAAGSIAALAALLPLAGAAIAPTHATVFAMVDHAAPPGTVTEAFAWLSTAIGIGASAGAACAGYVADAAGPASAFALAAAAAGAAALTAARRAQTLSTPGRPGPAAAPPEAVAEPAAA
jgi:predicted MFS family arabinose efflux permease